jgi:D-alanyl-D-alanine carboxypeptidase
VKSTRLRFVSLAALVLLLTLVAAAPASASTPPFQGSVHAIDAQLKAKMIASGSWKPGVPVSVGQLRLLKLSYWGFDGNVHTGNLMVNKAYAKQMVGVFAKLYAMKFAIHRMRLIDAYSADDHKSMAADNTSAFNGRYVNGTTRWSMHAYGLAIDINTVENPWVDSTHVSPPAGAPYADRGKQAKGMIHAGDAVVKAFESIGWKWGGYWSGGKDYQHFSSNGG